MSFYTNDILIDGTSAPLSQAQDHNMLCQFAIITNSKYIYLIQINCALNCGKTFVAYTERLATTLYRGWLAG
jgi:hypothetical protein